MSPWWHAGGPAVREDGEGDDKAGGSAPVSDEAADTHMARAVAEIVSANGGAHGDYLVVMQAANDKDGLLYTWRWAWSPQAPVHSGDAVTPLVQDPVGCQRPAR